MGQGRTTEMIDCKLSFVFALLILHAGAVAAETNLVAPTTVGPVAVRVYPAPGEKPRPTVLILQGRSGLVSGDEQYASEIAKAGMDAWLFSYYSATDDEVMRNADHSRRVEYFNDRFLDWAKAISDIAGFAFAQKNSSGRLGLLGLSNGGFLAVGAAAIDQRIGAIVVSYGGIANPTKNKISRLPPLLEIHGDADRVIPIAQGKALVDRAKALGGEAEQLVYPGAGHGFDLTNDDARSHAVDFLRRQLKVE
jgi:carboxymethylenebutenolidase